MTEPEKTTTALQTWWDTADFAGKEFCSLKENGELTIKTGDSERAIAKLNAENAPAVIKALTDKFPEVMVKLKELEDEWNSTEDKLKLRGKISRVKEYLLHANAIGDFNGLLEIVSVLEKEIKALADANYNQKEGIVKQFEALVENTITENNWKDATQKYRELSELWKQQGTSDKNRNEELWDRVEASRNKFFESKRNFQDAQEKDMLQNLDLKMEIAEKAEVLTSAENWREATETFKQLMEQWKTIGRVTPEKNEELWNRFITAKNSFFDRKKEHFQNIQQEQEENYLIKLTIVEKAEALQNNTDWIPATQVYSTLLDEWKASGRVPAEKADELWNRFAAAKENFFQAKRIFFETRKVSLEDNYAQKMALLKRGEEIKNSTQWRETTEEMNELMTEWKKIGAVQREHSDKIWKQFLELRSHFFKRKDEDRERRKTQHEKRQNARTTQTKTFLQTLEAELKEEEENLADFRLSLENVTPGPKEKELRNHLTELISSTEIKVEHKKSKIEELKNQMEDLTKKQPKEKEQPEENQE